jgi:hypothetical protein
MVDTPRISLIGITPSCECEWALHPFSMDHNDVVLCVAQHFIHDHDSEYSDVYLWVQENWRDCEENRRDCE